MCESVSEGDTKGPRGKGAVHKKTGEEEEGASSGGRNKPPSSNPLSQKGDTS